MKFCSHCAAPVEMKIPAGDNRLRAVCTACGIIHYENPKMVLGCVPVWKDQVLLCKRAIEPRYGFWTVPAGFMENGETLAEAAARETLEEALADVEIGQLHSVVDVKHARQVHMFFLATLHKRQFGAGEESLETELFSEEDIPWQNLAFPSTVFALKAYFADRARGRFELHLTSLPRLKLDDA